MNRIRQTLRSRSVSAALAVGLAALLSVANTSAAAATPTNPRLNDKFIISGASGQLGTLAIKELLDRGVPAKNLILVSRTPEKLAEYQKLGASTRFGDVDKPESLPAAYAGGTRMLMISLGAGDSTAPRPARHKQAFDAAAKAGVKQIAYTSFIGADDPNPTGPAVDHQQSEAFLKASGVAWTMLRNGTYMDGQLQNALRMAESGKATLAPGARKSAAITRQDCAAAGVAALLYPGHENKAYNITGPELIDASDVARTVAAITGKSVEVVPPESGATPQRSGGLPPPAPVGPSTAMVDITGRPATGIAAFLETHKAELIAAAAKR